MTEPPAAPPPGPAALLHDWITIWHSELAAAITDPELHETLLHLLDLWAAQAHRMAAATLEPAAGSPPPPRPAPAPAAPAGPAPRPASRPDLRPDPRPDPRDAVIAGLLARVSELERRLDERPA